jgi:hypothetical protein
MEMIHANVRNFLVLIATNNFKFVYTESMLSFWAYQVADWAVPGKLALWSSEGQNRQLAGVHLDFDTAGETWAEQVPVAACFRCGLLSCWSPFQYSCTEVLRYWNDTYEEDMGVTAPPPRQGLILDKGTFVQYFNEFEIQIPGTSFRF